LCIVERPGERRLPGLFYVIVRASNHTTPHVSGVIVACSKENILVTLLADTVQVKDPHFGQQRHETG
jgi:hypothetical protein